MDKQVLDLNHFLGMVSNFRFPIPKSVIFGMVYRYSSVMSIEQLCLKLHISRSGYYKWLKRRLRPDRDLILRDQIIAIQKSCDFTVGYHRMVDFLNRHYGINYNHKHVYRVMTKFGLLSHAPKRAKYTAIRKAAEAFPNLINGNFAASEPNKRWCTDITEFKTDEGKIYLCAIEDLYDRAIVSHSIGISPSHWLVKETIEKAFHQISDLPDHRIILHSDQGNVFKGKKYSRMLNRSQMTPSHSKKACPTQNAVIESFFATLKKELLHRYLFESRLDAIEAINEFIIFYNCYRIQTATGMTPFEIRFGKAN